MSAERGGEGNGRADPAFDGEASANAVPMAKGRARSHYMDAEARSALYSAMAGLVAGGMGVSEAAAVMEESYRTFGREPSADSVALFFGAVGEAGAGPSGSGRVDADRRRVLVEAAHAAFGRGFMGPEEMALLVSLPVSVSPHAVLSAAADVSRLSGASPSIRGHVR